MNLNSKPAHIEDAADFDIHIMLVDHEEFLDRRSIPSGTLIDTKGIWT